jgi:hypothetical protein
MNGVDQHAQQLAIRAHVLGVVVATAAGTLGCTGAKYTRTEGSFVADGFAVGMEVVAAGFTGSANGLAVVARVSDTELTVGRSLPTLAAGGGRTLTAGLPESAAWENTVLEPKPGRPFVEEEFLAGPLFQRGAGPGGVMESRPTYVLKVHVPASTGEAAARRYASALVRHFTPRQQIAVGDGSVLQVRADAGPIAGQLLPSRPGWVALAVTVSFWSHVHNTI